MWPDTIWRTWFTDSKGQDFPTAFLSTIGVCSSCFCFAHHVLAVPGHSLQRRKVPVAVLLHQDRRVAFISWPLTLDWCFYRTCWTLLLYCWTSWRMTVAVHRTYRQLTRDFAMPDHPSSPSAYQAPTPPPIRLTLSLATLTYPSLSCASSFWRHLHTIILLSSQQVSVHPYTAIPLTEMKPFTDIDPVIYGH